MIGTEQRFGGTLFRKILALHFSPSRPDPGDWTDHTMLSLPGVYGVLGTTDGTAVHTSTLHKMVSAAAGGPEA